MIRAIVGVILGFLIALLLGCAAIKDSFRPIPGRKITMPIRELAASGYTVSVQIDNSELGPYCSLPDAANEINCTFSWGWFAAQGKLVMGGADWAMIDPQGARAACTQALWSAQGGWSEVEACAHILLYYRFVIAPPEEEVTQ